MMYYSQNQYDALLEVCRSYRQDVERLKEVIANQNNLCWDCKKSVKEFAEKLKERCHNYYPSIDHYCCSVKAVSEKDIDDLLKEYKE